MLISRETVSRAGGGRRGSADAARIIRAEEPEIVIGAPNSLTGGLGEVARAQPGACAIAVDQINREGGIKSLGGAKVKLVVADTTSENPAQAASVTRRMIDQEGAVVLAGATASAMTLAAQVEAEKSQIPIVTNPPMPIGDRHARQQIHLQDHAAGRRDLELGDGCAGGDDQGRARRGAQVMRHLHGLRRGGHVGCENIAAGGAAYRPPIVSQVNFQGNLTDPSVAVSPILRNKPETIFLSAFLNDAVLVLKAVRGSGDQSAGRRGRRCFHGFGGQGTRSGGRSRIMPWSWNWDLAVPAESELNDAYKKPIRTHPIRPTTSSSARAMASA